MASGLTKASFTDVQAELLVNALFERSTVPEGKVPERISRQDFVEFVVYKLGEDRDSHCRDMRLDQVLCKNVGHM